MQDFIATSLKFQQIAFKTTASVNKLIFETYLNFIQQQFTLFDPMQVYRRLDDPHVASVNPKARKRKTRRAVSPCHGSDLKDHYGKRAQDVDVEHI